MTAIRLSISLMGGWVSSDVLASDQSIRFSEDMLPIGLAKLDAKHSIFPLAAPPAATPMGAGTVRRTWQLDENGRWHPGSWRQIAPQSAIRHVRADRADVIAPGGVEWIRPGGAASKTSGAIKQRAFGRAKAKRAIATRVSLDVPVGASKAARAGEVRGASSISADSVPSALVDGKSVASRVDGAQPERRNDDAIARLKSEAAAWKADQRDTPDERTAQVRLVDEPSSGSLEEPVVDAEASVVRGVADVAATSVTEAQKMWSGDDARSPRDVDVVGPVASVSSAVNVHNDALSSTTMDELRDVARPGMVKTRVSLDDPFAKPIAQKTVFPAAETDPAEGSTVTGAETPVNGARAASSVLPASGEADASASEASGMPEADAIAIDGETKGDGALTVGTYSFPENLLGALEQGVEVPVRITTENGTEEAGKASVKYVDGALTLTDFALNKIKLTEATKQLIASRYGKPLKVVAEMSPAGANVNGIRTEFNLRTFEVIAQLPKAAYSSEGEARSYNLADSTEQHLSGVLNYDVSVVKNARSDANGYLHLQSVTGVGVNHAYVEGDIRSGDDFNLYEARLERDYRGLAITGGYLSTWSMSALGQTTFLPGGRFIGVSAGNASRSEINDGSLARTPIFAFMPASGEVQLYRDGKLINVQQLPLGNQEINTRPLPVGSYTVRVDVVVNGRVVSSKTEQVYKPSNGGGGADTQFQVYGGQYIANNIRGQGSVSQPMFGVSGKKATKLGTFYGSSYYFDGLAAAELRYQRDFKHGTIGVDTGATTDGGYRFNANGSANIGPLGAWANYMLTTGSTEKNGIYNQRTTSFGSTISIARMFGWKNNATLNLSGSLYNGGSQDYRIDYSQDVYSNKWVRMTLNGGQMFSRSGNGGRKWNSAFYVGLNATFSWGDAGIDYSRSLDSEQIGAHVGWRPTHIAGVDYLSAGVNRSRSLNSSQYGNSSSTQLNLGAQGHNRWFGWQGNVNVDETGDANGTAAVQGSVGWNTSGIGFNSKKGESGVIVNVDKTARGNLEMISSGGTQSLDGRSTFVPLTGYKEHKVNIRTRRDTPENFDIQGGEAKLVLYPGNVASMQPKVRRLVTVFGVLTENGTVKPNTEIRNHIGKATTAADGGFVIDVDSAYPAIQYQTDAGGTCEIDFDLTKAQGALWVDQVECKPKSVARSSVPRQREG
ncbi:TcfC E-set like domain-containing protein [Burkholderia diffusa]|uniref:TcfC E-set like domain-containing protein n=1 Tax=Burkholderia diffusa TaxID=488732 RepID=UPI0014289D20|nr:TcfC E-set like domain-containing protein [Burkholderia diffusa]